MKCDCRECVKRADEWLDGIPGWGLTLVLLACFLAGAWAMFAIWSAGQTIINTAIKG